MKLDSKFTPILKDDDNAISISLPLCDRAYRELYNDKANPILRDKELAFVVLTQSPNSSIVKQGFEGKELVEAAKRELGLASNWKPSDKVKYAIQHYNKVNGSAITTYIKNLHIQYKNRNKSIDIIAKKVKLLQKQIESIEELGDTSTANMLEKIEQLVNLEKALDSLSKSVPEQVKTFNAALSELEEEIKAKSVTQGGGIVESSMDPKQSVITNEV